MATIVDISGVKSNQELFGTEYWIRAAHRLGVEWDYSSTVEKSEQLITEIQEKFMSALTDKSRQNSDLSCIKHWTLLKTMARV